MFCDVDNPNEGNAFIRERIEIVLHQHQQYHRMLQVGFG